MTYMQVKMVEGLHLTAHDKKMLVKAVNCSSELNIDVVWLNTSRKRITLKRIALDLFEAVIKTPERTCKYTVNFK